MLKLYRHQDLLHRFALDDRPFEIGRARGCDVALDDPELAERHWLLLRQHGTVAAYDVSARAKSAAPTYLAPGAELSLGRDHRIVRLPDPEPELRESATESLRLCVTPATWLGLVVGRGPEARVLRVGERPLHIGRGGDNDLDLDDRSVSERHCRLEPCAAGLLLRDLGSSNGTRVNGVQVETAFVRAGAQLRLGRTDVYVVERESNGCVLGTELVATTPAMLSVLAEATRAASLPWPALVLGESGTGKEGAARLLHEQGPRRGKPYVTLNAGGVPGELIESELFGHERGAFTGATQARRGVFEQAEGGTLFLDEIGELPMALQARLLRVLETGEVRRVGAETARRVDFRLVCATHRDLRVMVAEGSFREDLYFRIARLVIELPPLRERSSDIEPIVARILADLTSTLGPRELTEDALSRLRSHAWPGNVRELRNVVSAAAAATVGTRIEREDIERALCRLGGGPCRVVVSDETIDSVLARYGGNLSAAARALGMARSTLRDRTSKRG